MIEAAECVVIGSGALGASVAFHLAKAGKQVALLDQHALGSQTSPRAAGLTSQARGTDLMTQLAKRAVRKIETFREETGEPLAFEQPGALKIARQPAHVEQLKTEVERGRRMGTGVEMISAQEAQAKKSVPANRRHSRRHLLADRSLPGTIADPQRLRARRGAARRHHAAAHAGDRHQDPQ